VVPDPCTYDTTHLLTPPSYSVQTLCVQDVDITDGSMFPDKLEVDHDMLFMLVLNGVGGEVDGTDVVAIDESALGQWSMELLEELLEPTSFSHVIGHDVILSLGARSGDDVLAHGGPGDEVVIEKYSVEQGGLACIWATCAFHIHVDRQLEGGCRASQVDVKYREPRR
jgi:hypothetical protein